MWHCFLLYWLSRMTPRAPRQALYWQVRTALLWPCAGIDWRLQHCPVHSRTALAGHLHNCSLELVALLSSLVCCAVRGSPTHSDLSAAVGEG